MSLFSKKRPLTALQVEVTSRCTRSCFLCPRGALPDQWKNGDLTVEHWRKIVPALPMAEHVHLQGWGEPLLCGDLLADMTRTAKDAGATVGITTNGDPLKKAMDWILETGVDLVTLSMAGNRETHPEFRDGSDFDGVMEAIGALAGRKKQSKGRLKTQVSYLLTRKNAPHLPEVVDASVNAGVDELFVTHLDVTPTKALLDLAAFGANGLFPEVRACLDEAEKRAGRRIRFRGPPLQSEPMLACALNPARFVFVTWDGCVGPCVNLLFPVSGTIPRWDFDGRHQIEPVCYGHLVDADLAQILAGNARADFIAPLSRRLDAEITFLSSVISHRGVQALQQLDRADQKRNALLESTPFPEECVGCHKRFGW